jgi:hypothetical protein
VPEQAHGPPPLNRDLTPEERGAQLAQFAREIEHEQFWDTARTLIACVGWSAAGAVGMGCSFASSDARWAPVLFWAALTASYTGISVSLLGAYRRYLERTGET